MRRRRFVFWVGFGLFSLGEKLRAGGLDKLAAATMRLAEPETATELPIEAEHWIAAGNRSWSWFERENLVDGKWKLTGITTPIHKQTLERYTGTTGYLDDSLVPAELRLGEQQASESTSTVRRGGKAHFAPKAPKIEPVPEIIEPARHTPDPIRRARHGRPPSKWLRSLNADEIRTWLKTIEVPEAGVSGMTYWDHLTRDHSFDPAKIKGLTEDEQARLHAAAHYGY